MGEAAQTKRGSGGVVVNKKVKRRTVKAAQGVASFLLGLGPKMLFNRTKRDIEQGLRFPIHRVGAIIPLPFSPSLAGIQLRSLHCSITELCPSPLYLLF